MTTATAVRTTVELLRFQPQLPKTGHLFTALLQAAAAEGVAVTDSALYRGGSDLLVLWGPGALNRQDVIRQQLNGLDHVVAFDAAYWHRETKFRLSIDGAHCPQWIMRRDWPRDRFLADRVPVSNQWKPDGPVIIAGIGRKARAQFGASTVEAWEQQMVNAAMARWPNRPIWFRPKPFAPAARIPSGAKPFAVGPIERVLAGAGLVITWHSNVAVDAIRMGIPVICQDGAAAAVCASELSDDDPRPLDPEIRDRFLGNLAWFQWGTTASEASGCWRFLQELLS